jgi:hypothetical protein
MSHVHSTPLRYLPVSIRSVPNTNTPSPLVIVPELCPVAGMQEQTPGLITPLCFSRHTIATTFSVFTGAGSTQVEAAAAEYLPAPQKVGVLGGGVLGAGVGVAGAGVGVAGAGVGVAGAGVGVSGAGVGGE